MQVCSAFMAYQIGSQSAHRTRHYRVGFRIEIDCKRFYIKDLMKLFG